jgi:SPP1 gp7 family putative phage head morphogenesis protein
VKRSALITLATRHQVFLEKLKTKVAGDFASVLPKLEQAVSEIFSALREPSLSGVSRRKLEGLLTELKQEERRLIGGNEKVFAERLQEIHEYEISFEARTLDSVVAKGVVTNKLVVPKVYPSRKVGSVAKALREAYLTPLQANGQLLEPFYKGWGQNHIFAVEDAVRKSWAQGTTVGDLIKTIRGTKVLDYKDGLVTASRRQAEAVARTSVQHIAQSAHMQVWKSNDDIVTGYQFIATLDGRTTTQCRSLDKKEFKIGQGPTPPIHVNCRSTTIPTLGPEFDFLDEGATRSSQGGPVDAGNTYYDWLKTQPENFQKEVLGETRAKIFREGGLSAKKFADLNLNRRFEPMTLEEMKAKEPMLFEKLGIKL